MRPWRAVLAVAGLLALCAAVPAALPATTAAFTRDAGVAALVDEAAGGTADLERSLRHLTGVVATSAGGRTQRIWTRHAGSGAPVVTAQRYVHGRLRALGLAAGYQRYGSGTGRRNVVGEIRGSLEPARIVLITAHLDDMPASGPAPGADDNGSGCAALLYLASQLAGHRFNRTLRFVFFGGEEIGALGSAFAAERARRTGEDIVAVLNVDAVGWNGRGTRVLEVHRRQAGAPGSRDDLAIATLLEQVVATYGIDLRIRDQADALSYSDHASYWSQGYGAVWVTEDSRPFANPAWHTRHDTMRRLTLSYLLSVTKALLATSAHLARLEPSASTATAHRAPRGAIPVGALR